MASLALRTREVENHTFVLNVVRFQEIINGRTYLIEVLAVERDRWRAQVVRRPDRATAVMPFYGTTRPDEAARETSGRGCKERQGQRLRGSSNFYLARRAT